MKENKSRLPLVNIIILNWNGYKDTIECVGSVLKNNYSNYAITIVDNNSDVDDILYLKKWSEQNLYDLHILREEDVLQNKIIINNYSERKYFLIENNSNYGFAKGNNIGIKFSHILEADLVLLLNNDTVVEVDFLSKLVEFKRLYPEFYAVTPQIRYYDNKEIIWNCGGKLMWYGSRKYFFANKHFSLNKRKEHFEITFITGCCLFYDYKQCGYLTERFFFGEEDFEFSLRMKKSKKKMACLNNSLIYHKVGSTVNKTNVKLINKLYLHYLNRFINLKIHNRGILFYIQIFLNTNYIIYLLVFRFGISLVKTYQIIKNLLNDTRKYNEVDNNKFLEILNQ